MNEEIKEINQKLDLIAEMLRNIYFHHSKEVFVRALQRYTDIMSFQQRREQKLD